MIRFLIYGFFLYIQVRIYGNTIYSGRLPTGAEILGTIITFCVALVIDLMIQAKNKGLKLDDNKKSPTPYLDSIQHDPKRSSSPVQKQELRQDSPKYDDNEMVDFMKYQTERGIFEISEESFHEWKKLKDKKPDNRPPRIDNYNSTDNRKVNYVQTPHPSPPEAPEREKTLDEIFEELNSQIGLDSIKQEVRQLADYMIIEKRRAAEGKKSSVPNLHMVFTGNAGTGKTTVAQLIGSIYKSIGLLSKGHTVFVSRNDLVGETIGSSAPKTMERIQSAMGGILFIDEAYSIHQKLYSSTDFGEEVISTLIQEMENNRGKFCVILAGYSEDMERMLSVNQGMKSRISTYINFPDYTQSELEQIFKKMCLDMDIKTKRGVVEKASATLESLRIKMLDGNARFANGREVRNLVEKAIKNQRSRIVRDNIEGEEADYLIPADIPDFVQEDNTSTRNRIGF